jgi:hypothetical protein
MGKSGATSCTNIELIDCTSLRNVRQGLSVVAADGFAVIGGRYNDTSGSNPGAGIDVEADPGGDVRNGRIIGVDLSNNYTSLVLTESSSRILVSACQMRGSRKTTLICSEVINATIIGNYLAPAQTVDGPIVDMPDSTDVVFANNIIEGQGAASSHEGAGIRFAINSTNISIINNIFKTTRTQGVNVGSSALAGTPTLINISGNTFIDCLDSTAFANGAVIGCGGNTVAGNYPARLIIRNNIIRDTRGTPTTYGVQLQNIPAAITADYRVEGNVCQGVTTGFNDNISTVPPLCGLVTWNPGNLVAGAAETSPDITVLGAALGDSVEVYEPYAIGDCIAKGSVKSTNTCVIRLANTTGAADFNGASGSWRVRVRKLFQA